MKTVLLATNHKFWLANRGARIRIAHLYRFLLEAGFKVPVFFPGTLDEADRQHIECMRPRPDLVPAVDTNNAARRPETGRHAPGTPLRRLLRVPRSVAALLARIRQRRGPAPRAADPSGDAEQTAPAHGPPRLCDFTVPAWQQAFRAACLEVLPHVVLVEGIGLCHLLQALPETERARPSTVIDTHDVMHKRYRRFRIHGEPHWIQIDRDEEADALRPFDVVLAIQNRDAATFREMLPNKRILTVSHAHPIPPAEPYPERAPLTLCYVASHGHHNRRALAQFLESVWPKLNKRLGRNLAFAVYGQICEVLDPNALPDGVRLQGKVEKLEPVYRNADIVINPVFFGGGLKIKNVEALCSARPLLTTRIGAEGIEHGADSAFLVADTDDQMCEQLVRLATQPQLRRKLAAEARRFALENFSEQAAYGPLRRLLEEELPLPGAG